MAYLSSDQITGKVLVNLHSDGLAIYNNTSIKRNIEKSQIYFGDKPVTTVMTKFSKGSILNEFYVPIEEDISGDFTFSLWGYVTNGYGFLFLISNMDKINTKSYVIGIGSSESSQTYIKCIIGTEKTEENTWHSKTVTNAWHHFALCRSNNMLYWFIDGELVRTLDVSDSKYKEYFTNHDLFKNDVGFTNHDWYGNNSTVYVDDVVVIKDQCLWTEKFTPPTDVLVGDSPKYMQVLYPLANEKDRLKIY